MMRFKVLRIEGDDLLVKNLVTKSLAKIDPFVGCALHEDFDLKTLIGQTVEIPDDCHIYQPLYIPEEKEFKILKEQAHEQELFGELKDGAEND